MPAVAFSSRTPVALCPRPRVHGGTEQPGTPCGRAAIAAHPDVITITSFNEWGKARRSIPPACGHGYRTYDGAWGLTDLAAQTAYLDHTAYWAARHRGLRERRICNQVAARPGCKGHEPPAA